jgi:chromosome segregation ATPase
MFLIAITFNLIDGLKLIFQTWDTALLVSGSLLVCVIFLAGIILFLYEREYRAKINHRDSKIENLESVIKSLEERLKNREEKLERVVDEKDKELQNEHRRYEEEVTRIRESNELSLRTIKEEKDKAYRGVANRLSQTNKQLEDFRDRIRFLVEQNSYLNLKEDEFRERIQKLIHDIKTFSSEQDREKKSLPPLDNSLQSLLKPVSFLGSALTDEQKVRRQHQEVSEFISKEFKKRFQVESILFREILIIKLATNQKVNCVIEVLDDEKALSMKKVLTGLEIKNIYSFKEYQNPSTPESLNKIAAELEDLLFRLIG